MLRPMVPSSPAVRVCERQLRMLCGCSCAARSPAETHSCTQSGSAMAFFRDRTVNLLNLHYGIHAIALSGGGAFFAVYLLRSGLSVPEVLASLASILAGRFIIRPVVVPLAAKFGLRALVIGGTCLTALQYPLLAEVR